MPIRYAPGKYNRAAGTRAAFAGLSADLEREGHSAIVVNDGDREPQDEIDVFLSRFRLQASGSGPYGDVRWWEGRRYVRFSGKGTVAVPGTGNHGKRRANDLAWPYNDASTTAHKRAQTLAEKRNITCEGLGFKEPWHWTFWGALGAINQPASGGNQSEEDDMTPDQAQKLDAVYAALFGPANLKIPKMTWANPDGQKEAFYGLLDISIYSQALISQNAGVLAGLKTAVSQLSAGSGVSLDMQAIEDAAERGAKDALRGLVLTAEAG